MGFRDYIDSQPANVREMWVVPALGVLGAAQLGHEYIDHLNKKHADEMELARDKAGLKPKHKGKVENKKLKRPKSIKEAFYPDSDVESYQLNEDLKTFGHNLWTRSIAGMGMHSLNLKRLKVIPMPGNLIGFLSNIFHGADKIDYNYFKSMYVITDRVKNKLLSILQKSYKDAVIVGKGGVKDSTNAHPLDFNSKEHGLASRHMRQATADLGGITTTATCFYKLPIKSGYYILYFTFDGDDIKNCQVLCKKPNSDNDDYDSYYTRKMPEFNQIPEHEYKKG